ncbi:MAG: putative membrane-bound dehydrogenase-like protein [Pseudoalteromonas tetraodonis]|jgi:putative membrane-bound dehydrogenase-like protein
MQLIRYTLTALVSLTSVTALVGAEAEVVPLDFFTTEDPNLEVTLWAQTPMFNNPTNMDIDKDGRIWVAEGVNYRRHGNRRPEGDRIVVLQDSTGDGKADKSHVFVQEKFLNAPLGVAVLDNKIIVSMTPSMIVYTDKDRDLVFDASKGDTREELLTGFSAPQHDHTLHSVTAGPDGQWYWNHGNCGGQFTDKSGKTFRLGSAYMNQNIAGKKSDDGHVYIGGASYRMNPDGTHAAVIGHNYRNSYEQTITSFGDVFQNDNDDPPACRVTHVLEYGNAGFCSFDGKRSWGADRRPGQETAIAEWRQEDPGTMPAGDVYGGGSPTGITYYEGGALGKKYANGLLLSCEPGRNTVFGYLPVPDGAGFKLERFDFVTTNSDGEFAGSDFIIRKSKPNKDNKKTLFRPSDVTVGADGAIYICDWYDARVGGHSDLDDTLSGAIYRIAPKDFKSTVPKLDLERTDGQIAALKSSAINVRNLGFTRLKEGGEKSVSAVSSLLEDPNKFVHARAVWLLSQLGDAGVAKVKPLLDHADPEMRTVAYRALRRQNIDLLTMSKKLASDTSAAVRREVALAMRNLGEEAVPILTTVAAGFDGIDRSYLEAIGTGATRKEAAVYDAVIGKADATKWTATQAKLAWRLHPAQSAVAFKARAMATPTSPEDKKAAMVALAYIPEKEGATAMLNLAQHGTGETRGIALSWLLKLKSAQWKDYGLDAELKTRKLYNPANVQLVEVTSPPAPKTQLPPISEILSLKGDVAKGLVAASRCYVCHKISGDGIVYGPDITSFAKTQTPEVVLKSIIDPSADISHGFAGREIITKDGKTIHGIQLTSGDPLIIQSTGGLQQTIPKGKIKSQKDLGRSLMLSAEQLGMTAQDLADLLAYLRSL